MSSTPALELIALKKIYKNGVEALKGINLTVQAGDFMPCLGQMVQESQPPLV